MSKNNKSTSIISELFEFSTSCAEKQEHEGIKSRGLSALAGSNPTIMPIPPELWNILNPNTPYPHSTIQPASGSGVSNEHNNDVKVIGDNPQPDDSSN